MFSSIAARYDLLNHVLSLNVDRLWRKRAARLLESSDRVLDVATGTGDVVFALFGVGVGRVIGVDLSFEMLKHAAKKSAEAGNDVDFVCATGENLPFADGSFDGVIIAFGIRNIIDRMSALFEFHRVLRERGRLVVLEFGIPPSWVVRRVYGFYSDYILPTVGRLVSGSHRAYRYLPTSIRSFPDVEFLGAMMERAGFREVDWYPLSFGISYIHTGVKF